MYEWSRFMTCDVTGTRVRRVGEGRLASRGYGSQLVYLTDHRGWGDFFIDIFLTEGRAQILSRAAVFNVFPVLMVSCMAVRGIVFFRRGEARRDIGAFNARLDDHLCDAPTRSLVLYPEGTRNRSDEPLPFRRGLLLWAHSRGIPVQVYCCEGKERVLGDETRPVGSRGVTLRVCYGDVIDATDYPDNPDAFVAACRREFERRWREVRAAKAAEDEGAGDVGEGAEWTRYPLTMRASVGLSALGAMALLSAWVATCWWAASRVAGVTLGGGGGDGLGVAGGAGWGWGGGQAGAATARLGLPGAGSGAPGAGWLAAFARVGAAATATTTTMAVWSALTGRRATPEEAAAASRAALERSAHRAAADARERARLAAAIKKKDG